MSLLISNYLRTGFISWTIGLSLPQALTSINRNGKIKYFPCQDGGQQ